VIKRLFDVVAAAGGLAVTAPLFLLIAAAIKLDSPGPVLFRQQRLGRDFRPFQIFKFRTMVYDAPQRGSAITVGDDPRITRVGKLLRRSKLDELPQLLNVLRGDMSIVGPRPEVPQYVQMFRDDYAEILKVRPGITDLASVAYADEEALLAQASEPAEVYSREILPRKIELARESIRRSSLFFDLAVIVRTAFSVINPRARF
jgi:lipopolysaccharide/colanic/teichoic acid biosynthesis glycosyltransferase